MNRRLISRILCVSLGLGILLPMGACIRKPNLKWFAEGNFLKIKIHWTKINAPNPSGLDKFVGCVVIKDGLTLGDVSASVDHASVAIQSVADVGSIVDELLDGCYAPGTDTISCFETVNDVDLSDDNSVEMEYTLTNGGTSFTTTTCGGGTNLTDLGSLLNFSSYSQAVTFDPLVLPLCEVGNGNLGCAAGCTEAACGGDEADDCSAPAVTATLDEVTNLDTIDLALVQKNFKINKFQEWTLEILQKNANVQIVLINGIHDVKPAVAAKPGSHVAIFGHGNVGEIKVGNDTLNKANAAEFGASLKGQVKALSLFGCKTGANQQFLKDITEALQRPVHAWEGKVYAFGDDAGIPEHLRNKFFTDPDTDKKEIPTVSEWGLAVMCLLVLTAGTVVVMRRRAIVMA